MTLIVARCAADHVTVVTDSALLHVRTGEITYSRKICLLPTIRAATVVSGCAALPYVAQMEASDVDTAEELLERLPDALTRFWWDLEDRGRLLNYSTQEDPTTSVLWIYAIAADGCPAWWRLASPTFQPLRPPRGRYVMPAPDPLPTYTFDTVGQMVTVAAELATLEPDIGGDLWATTITPTRYFTRIVHTLPAAGNLLTAGDSPFSVLGDQGIPAQA